MTALIIEFPTSVSIKYIHQLQIIEMKKGKKAYTIKIIANTTNYNKNLSSMESK